MTDRKDVSRRVWIFCCQTFLTLPVKKNHASVDQQHTHGSRDCRVLSTCRGRVQTNGISIHNEVLRKF